MAMTAVAARGAEARLGSRTFYVWMAVGFIAAAFLGFAPTYWAPLATGKLNVNPIVHVHGMVFFAWTLFFLLQTGFVATEQVLRHRAVGMIGISLATAMTILGPLVALNSLKIATALGAGRQAEAFVILPLTGIALFAGFFALAMANTHRPEVHKRLMVLATIAILDAPLARPFMAFVFTSLPPGPPPVWIGLPAYAVSYLFLAAALIYDWRTRGRPHPAYLAGGAAIVAVQLLRLPVSGTAAWHGLAHAFVGLAGSIPHGA
jgi:hypothetical protein